MTGDSRVNVLVSPMSAKRPLRQFVDIKEMKMKMNSKEFPVRAGAKAQLTEWPTIVKPFCKSKEEYQELPREHVEELSSLQHLHYAS